MLGSNFLNVYDNNSGAFYRSPYGRPLNPMTYEERRQRAETERCNQWKHQELRRKREEEALRSKQAQEEYVQRIHEAERQERLRSQQMSQGRDPMYTVVRGPDGRLYRIPVEHGNNNGHHLASTTHPTRRIPRKAPQPAKRDKQSVARGPAGGMYLVPPLVDVSMADYYDNESAENNMQNDSIPSKTSNPVGAHIGVTNSNISEEVDSTMMMDEASIGASTKNPRRRVTIIVEDVPENEAEDEAKSIWRNRRPGPGESWMEPNQGTLLLW